MTNYQIFRNPYILIEDIKNKYQPYFKEYQQSTLPKLNLESTPFGCPFAGSRKYKPTKRKKTIKQGFCEVCYTKFSNYDEHVKESEHRSFAVNNRNYRDVDEIIGAYDLDLESDPAPNSPLLRKTYAGCVYESLGAEVAEFDCTKESIDMIAFSFTDGRGEVVYDVDDALSSLLK